MVFDVPSKRLDQGPGNIKRADLWSGELAGWKDLTQISALLCMTVALIRICGRVFGRFLEGLEASQREAFSTRSSSSVGLHVLAHMQASADG